ncbi:adenylate/guanylate cyclase domain-containing protein [Mycobacterium sp. CVI_P3]|uniref:Adenylate/guanylate cyclase domain-containing protein n=1 Tax=Mycobacterium pinniadriaticum TaxID=2994102 RepID=A0ABT3SP04_9MYCO|nr:adenylate/guanylate cyclase domain-containing protein [Mycobacterium pinniadriaticum]MCX2934855.1 adenylate/guanylate cyclase domain-containing protein [Mycobacterium pinniadriaticum]MCX2941268.1 adenylate/guanylate cyclase domain-containing protein [Mycobacterium pinniadriaticum]
MAGLVLAQILAGLELTAIMLPLKGQAVADTHEVFGPTTLTVGAGLTVLGVVSVAVYGFTKMDKALQWYATGAEPDLRQRKSARRFTRDQTIVFVTTWLLSGLVLVLLNYRHGAAAVVFIVLAVAYGAATSSGAALLFGQRVLRPVIAAARTNDDQPFTAPGVLARLLQMWLLCSALPTVGIAVLVMMHAHGWIIDQHGSIELPVVTLSLVTVLVGLRGMIVVSRSVSDPVGEVVDAMADVERGRIDRFVAVYDPSEIGRLQVGFNRMVTGLAERDSLRDLFGRHVGSDVARRAVDQGQTLSGDVRDVAILFIDLVGSTQLAQTRSPAEVAEVLNHFFRIVVAEVDQRHGLINKFQGDAALAVFGAPLPSPESASDALSTARTLAVALQQLPVVDFGIGVSAGAVFAGNVGAEHRYEYTVVGDPVNEAARLADRAKASAGRLLCSAAVLHRANDVERRQWASYGSEILRGRLAATQMFRPDDANE